MPGGYLTKMLKTEFQNVPLKPPLKGPLEGPLRLRRTMSTTMAKDVH